MKKIEGRVLQDVKEWNFLVMFKFNGKSKFDTVVTIQMLREPLAQLRLNRIYINAPKPVRMFLT